MVSLRWWSAFLSLLLRTEADAVELVGRMNEISTTDDNIEVL